MSLGSITFYVLTNPYLRMTMRCCLHRNYKNILNWLKRNPNGTICVAFVAMLSDRLYQSSALEGFGGRLTAYLRLLTAITQQIRRGRWMYMFSRLTTSKGCERLQFRETFHMDCFLLHLPGHIKRLQYREIVFSSYYAVLHYDHLRELMM